MEYKINALSIYEYGQRKDKDGNPHQEDWIYPAMGAVSNEKSRLFILCDGMGGHSAGEVASEAVCEAMSETVNKALDAGEKFSEALLLKAISNAYDLLDERDTCEDSQKKMGTTMTFLMLYEQGATIAHIGDSRVYHIRPKTGTKADIVFETRDHSLVNDLLKAGELTPEEAETFPRKNVITRAMQPKLDYRFKADIKIVCDIMPGDYFYMCSDGMLEQTSDDNLCYMLNKDVTDEEKRNMLIRNSSKNKDNHSAHLIHILDVEPKPALKEAPLAAPASSDEEIDDDIVDAEFDSESGEDNSTNKIEESTNSMRGSSGTARHTNPENTSASSSEESNNPRSTTTQTQYQPKPQEKRKEPTTSHFSRKTQRWLFGILLCIAAALIASVFVRKLFHHTNDEQDNKEAIDTSVGDNKGTTLHSKATEDSPNRTTGNTCSVNQNTVNNPPAGEESAPEDSGTTSGDSSDTNGGQTVNQDEPASSNSSSSPLRTSTGTDTPQDTGQGESIIGTMFHRIGSFLNGDNSSDGVVESAENKITNQ